MKTQKRPKKFEVQVRQIGSKKLWGGTVKFSNIAESENKSALQLAIEAMEAILSRMKTDLGAQLMAERMEKDLYEKKLSRRGNKIVGLSEQVGRNKNV
jgi:hypothetical protein